MAEKRPAAPGVEGHAGPRRRRGVLYAALGLLLLAIYGFATRRPEGGVAWRDDFDAAVAEARSREVPILLDFWAEWCPPCRTLDETLFASAELRRAAREGFVPMRVDLTPRPPGERAAALARRYGVTALPTVLVIDAASGAVLARPSHAEETSPAAFVSFLERARRRERRAEPP